MNCRASPCSCRSLTSNMWSTGCSTPCAGSTIRGKLDIQLLDDSTDETVEVARILVDRYAALGHPVTYLHRDNREGYKAGALAEGLKTAKGEFVAIFDADFVPPPDFLAEVHPSLHRSQGRHGADAVDAHQPQLFVADRGRSHSARWPFRAGTLGTVAQRRFL